MWEVDCEESGAPKNWCFWTVVLEKTLESPLDYKEIQPSNQSILKEISPGISLEGMMLKLKLQYFGHLIQRNTARKITTFICIWTWFLLLPQVLWFQSLFITILPGLAGSKISQALAPLFEEGSGQTENPELVSKFDRSYKRTTATNTWNPSHEQHLHRVKPT